MRILFFGDSITQGFWDVEGGWVARIDKKFRRDAVKNGPDGLSDCPSVFNLGVSGASSGDIVKRLDFEARQRNNGEDLVIVIAIGVNDSRIEGDTEYTDTAAYRDNLAKIYADARKHTDQVIFVGLTPCVESRTNPVSWNPTSYLNDRITSFDSTLTDFCKSNDVKFIPVLEEFTEELYKQELMPDGLHPNEAGHELIAQKVLASLTNA